MYLVRKEERFEDFFNDYYLPTLDSYRMHNWLKTSLTKSNIEDVRASRVVPGEAC